MAVTGTSLFVMAWRNLWRNRRRTLLTLASIVFGVFMAILFTAMQDQNWADMINLAARMGGGHVTVQHHEYLETPTLSRTVSRTDEIVAMASQDPRVERVVERIVGQTMLGTARESFGAGFLAFDPAVEDEATLSLIEALAEGEMFEDAESGGIILGFQLAKNLDADMGDKIVYTMTDRHGEIVYGLARLSGVVRTGAPSIDAGLCLLPLGAVRTALGYAPDEANQVAVFIDDQRGSEEVARRVGADLGSEAVAVPWSDAQPELATFIALKVGGARFMEIVIALLVAAGIFNTLFVSVMERLREFGIMMAVGFRPSQLFRLVMYESLFLGVVGIAGALVVTAGPYAYLSKVGVDISAMLQPGTEVAGVAMPSVFRVGIFPESLAIILVLAFIAVLLSGVYPAWKAGRVDPVESIKLV